jgi:phosphatidylserine/phosphatidylglycerophosphate/cardiolipin synthase-like enzyme
MSKARARHTATLLADGRVLITGGGIDGLPQTLSSANIYDPATGRIDPAGDMNSPRGQHTATLLPDGNVLIAGGFDGNLFLSSAEIYEPVRVGFQLTVSMATSRVGHTATLLRDGSVLIVGGSNASDRALASAELYLPAGGGPALGV